MLTLLSRLEPELNAVLGALLSKFTTPEKAIHMELVMDMMQHQNVFVYTSSTVVKAFEVIT